MSWLPPVVIFDLDDTLINFTGMAEELWRVICDESAPGLGLEGGALHAALMTERVSFWADPELNRFGRYNLGEASRAVVGRAFTALGVGTAEQAAALARQYSDRRHDLVHLYEESIATIEELRARGHRLAMITNGGAASQRAKIVRFDLAKHFD